MLVLKYWLEGRKSIAIFSVFNVNFEILLEGRKSFATFSVFNVSFEILA